MPILFNFNFWYFIILPFNSIFFESCKLSTCPNSNALVPLPLFPRNIVSLYRLYLFFLLFLLFFLTKHLPQISPVIGQYSKPSQVSIFTVIQTILRSKSKMPAGTSVHVTALDGIVNVNSLFTLAVFVGLAWNPNDPSNTLINDQACAAGPSKAEDLVAFHVYSFSSFLFSSLIALGLKQAIRISKSPTYHPYEFIARTHKSFLRVGMLVSGIGSFSGCGFLMMALVNVVQIKLGTLACGTSSDSFAAVIPLVILVPVALLIYASIILYAFSR